MQWPTCNFAMMMWLLIDKHGGRIILEVLNNKPDYDFTDYTQLYEVNYSIMPCEHLYSWLIRNRIDYKYSTYSCVIRVGLVFTSTCFTSLIIIPSIAIYRCYWWFSVILFQAKKITEITIIINCWADDKMIVFHTNYEMN